MKISDLDPAFLAFTEQKGKLGCHEDYHRAQGVYFQCPKCTPEGKKHSYTLLFPSAPEGAQPHGRWNSTGTSLNDLTLLEPVVGECGYHGYVHAGEVRSVIV